VLFTVSLQKQNKVVLVSVVKEKNVRYSNRDLSNGPTLCSVFLQLARLLVVGYTRTIQEVNA